MKSASVRATIHLPWSHHLLPAPRKGSSGKSGAVRPVVRYGAAMTTTTHALIAQAAMPAARKRAERRALVR
ncbi:hypothetical protein GCM10010532_014880 [Dactylosporangium siamense]|uniref:Uncharacterized protein n=1 Tax=Dactylosporangium siamense TaxID=685454 RepID=A0A919PF62_9ACTN|nr:hypothetical protein Dsi01nite_001520 [Dactylosporangium siamense]